MFRSGKGGGLKVTATWPGVAEHQHNYMRGPIFEQLLGDGKGRSLLDLGAGPCLFSKRGVKRGWKVTAVDARTERLPDDLEGITFIEGDIREFDPTGFDTVAILGLLYHLRLNEQLELLQRCNKSRVILETQVHTPGYVPPAAEPWGHEIVELDGLQGVVFPEGDNPMASIGNPTSFWVTHESMLELVARAGFGSCQVVEPVYHSKYGTRRYYVLKP